MTKIETLGTLCKRVILDQFHALMQSEDYVCLKAILSTLARDGHITQGIRDDLADLVKMTPLERELIYVKKKQKKIEKEFNAANTELGQVYTLQANLNLLKKWYKLEKEFNDDLNFK